MRAVVTRVSSASVTIEGKVEGAIEKGFLVLLGVGPEDNEAVCDKLAEKICNLRVFEDENGKMNRAAKPELAVPLYERFLDQCRQRGFTVEHGQFGADMQVASVNDGPVTILFDTDKP